MRNGFTLCARSGEWVWVDENDMNNECRYVPKNAHPQKVMVWCAISYCGRSSIHLFPQDEKVDQVAYRDCLEKALLPSISDREYLFPNGEPDSWVFMQDGAGPHRAKGTVEWLAEHLPANASLNDGDRWPARSPDMNPIEELWNFFQNRVVEHLPQTFEEFEEILVDSWWHDISQEYIQKLYDSMPRRIEMLISVDGKPTKY
jgi:hypothetical protein